MGLVEWNRVVAGEVDWSSLDNISKDLGVASLEGRVDGGLELYRPEVSTSRETNLS